MHHTHDIREGYEVYDPSDTLVGRVRHVSDDVLDLGDRRIPTTGISRVEGNRVYLAASADAATGARGGLHERGTETHIPVVEEQLNVEKQAGQIGEVRVHREVISEEQSIPVELTQERVEVEERDTQDRVLSAAEAADAFTEQTIRVPIRGERAEVTKQAVQTGEVVIGKEQETRREEIRDTVRREEVRVDQDYEQATAGFQQHYQSRTDRPADRGFEEAEPHYRYGWQARQDQRWAGREWDEAEPELREEYQRAGYTDDEWQHLREEIRECWNRVRR